MQGVNVNRRAIFLGLTAVLLSGCDRLATSSAARVATLNVQTAARPAFVAAIHRFADLHHFQVKTVKLVAPGRSTLKLERADMEIALSNDDSGDGNPLAWEVTCYRSHSGSKATTAEIDELTDEFLANTLDVHGVLLISSDRALPGAPPPSSAAVASSY